VTQAWSHGMDLELSDDQAVGLALRRLTGAT
jgi:hypothetical protein